MKNLTIRPAVITELEQLLSIEQLIIDAERPFEKNIKQHQPVTYYDLKDLIHKSDSLVLVAEDGGQIVATGYAKIKPSLDYLKDDYHAYLGFMYVHPKYRGKGLNYAIIQQLIEWTKQQNLEVVCLEVLNDNRAAIKAYAKAGFKKNLVEMRLNLNQQHQN